MIIMKNTRKDTASALQMKTCGLGGVFVIQPIWLI